MANGVSNGVGHRASSRTVTLLVVAGVALAAGVGCRPSWPEGPPLRAPKQTSLPFDAPKRFMFRGHVVEPQFAYDIEAVVLSKEHYRIDPPSAVSTVDLALGWGPMSKSEILATMYFHQNARFYSWTTQERPPLPLEELGASAANVHLVYAADAVEDVIDDVDPGDVVRLEGALVNVTFKEGWTWTSSTRRDDTGDGACEILWVDRAAILR